MRPSEVWVKKCLRDLDMGPPRSIVAECRGQKKWSTYPAELCGGRRIVNGRRVTVLWLMMARVWDCRGKALTGQDGDTRQWKNNLAWIFCAWGKTPRLRRRARWDTETGTMPMKWTGMRNARRWKGGSVADMKMFDTEI